MKNPNMERIFFEVSWGHDESYGVKRFDSADSADKFFWKMHEHGHLPVAMKIHLAFTHEVVDLMIAEHP